MFTSELAIKDLFCVHSLEKVCTLGKAYIFGHYFESCLPVGGIV